MQLSLLYLPLSKLAKTWVARKSLLLRLPPAPEEEYSLQFVVLQYYHDFQLKCVGPDWNIGTVYFHNLIWRRNINPVCQIIQTQKLDTFHTNPNELNQTGKTHPSWTTCGVYFCESHVVLLILSPCIWPVISLVGLLSPTALLAVTSVVWGSKLFNMQESPVVLHNSTRSIPDTL